MGSQTFIFTVFTPTYNRAHLLPRVFISLKRQTFTDFEWLVVDDGSTDHTSELIARWQQEAPFPIRYIWQPNQHKKVAHNRAVKEAKGEFLLVFDSDDECVPNALERFLYYWESIPFDRREEFSGVCALCMDEYGRIVGERFPGGEYFDSNSLDLFYRYHVRGEKWGVHRVEVLREYLFPEDIPGHVPENIVWHAIARRYKTRYVNEALRIYHTGHTDRLTTTRSIKANAIGHYKWMEQILEQEIEYFHYAPLWFLKVARNWTRFGRHAGILSWRDFERKNLLARALVALTFPAGHLLAGIDHRLERRKG